MKRRSLFVLTFAFSLLFTSCLADYLNGKMGYSVPIFINYSSNHGTMPKSKKIPSGQVLTKEDLPELSEQGYIFDGWYSDFNYTHKIEEGSLLNEDTTLYAKWSPRTDIPFTIHNYLLDPRSTGIAEFMLRTDFTQHLTGTTNETIQQELYDVRYSDLYNPELDSFEFVYWWNDDYNNTKIKADGSTIVNNYYYLNKIYDYEFEPIIRTLPDTSWCYRFFFIQETNVSSYDFYYIKEAIRNSSRILDSNYDQYTGKTMNKYNKHYALDFSQLTFTQITEDTFNSLGALNQVDLPSTCTRIGSGAFYGCNNLEYVYTYNNDYSKSWHYSDEYGNIINLGTNPNATYFAELLRTSYFGFDYY